MECPSALEPGAFLKESRQMDIGKEHHTRHSITIPPKHGVNDFRKLCTVTLCMNPQLYEYVSKNDREVQSMLDTHCQYRLYLAKPM